MRKRSGTAQSVARASPPLEVGASTTINLWVHAITEPKAVYFSHACWPGVAEGDMVSVTGNGPKSFFFIVGKVDPGAKPLSISQNVSEAFGLRARTDVVLEKVDRARHSADFVELHFQDQYIGRNDMWRLAKQLVGQCLYTDQDVNFIGIAAKIKNIYIEGRQVLSACMTPQTKTIYRSQSAKVTIFIQVCRELWQFAGDGERYNEKIVHSFLPSLFAKWAASGANHTVTIVLISRVFYDESEIDYAAGPLRRDERGQWYKDFYKVITDLEVIHEWKPTLVSLKNSFWDFQRDILLTHHHHRGILEGGGGAPEQVRLVGHLSYAQDGPLLEALNLNLNPTETHYIDRSLQLTGAATLLITPGTGYFRVSKQLLRLTTTRMLDQGFGLDLICLGNPPLHQSPILSFQGIAPAVKKKEVDGGAKEDAGSRENDSLWGGDDAKDDARKKVTLFWEPFWISVSFWDKQMDMPFREDRFVARAKMHEIQMLGLLEHDVLSSIEVPFLKDTPSSEPLSPSTAQKFDNDIFVTPQPKTDEDATKDPARASTITSPSADKISPSYRVAEKRPSHRNSLVTPRVPPIEESPRKYHADLPFESPSGTRNPSPSGSSMRSLRSTLSTYSSRKGSSRDPSRELSLSKLTPSWLFRPFRSAPSEPQTSPIQASAASTPSISQVSASTSTSTSGTSLSSSGSASQLAFPTTPSPQPLAIKPRASPLSPALSRATGSASSHDEAGPKRRSTAGSQSSPRTSSSPIVLPNPSMPVATVPPVQSSLASRWQHLFARPAYKHDIKWTSIVTPGCLPLTVEYFPTMIELENCYDVFSYDFVVDPVEMRSFMVQPTATNKTPPPGSLDEARRSRALVVMRGMAAVRLAQGFQFVLNRPKSKDGYGGEQQQQQQQAHGETPKAFYRSPANHRPFMGVPDDEIPKPGGASEVLMTTTDPVYLSMSNEIHRISYTGEAIQVRRYVRRMPDTLPFQYECLIWPKLGLGYTEQKTTFTSHGLENYGWNRLDMLVAGYEQQFNESLRYWRTRFVVIPTPDPPSFTTDEQLSEEEIRILGVEKLAEQFAKVRWQNPDDKTTPAPTVRFLPTTLSPAASVQDEELMAQLDSIHATGPLKKKPKSEREVGGMSLSAIAKAMREEDAVPIKLNQWHRTQYPDTFTGYDFVSWLAREFRDVSSRAQGTEVAAKLMNDGLIEHCRGQHGFLDGHYFYRLKGDYASTATPRWLPQYPLSLSRSNQQPIARAKLPSAKASRKRLILSQTMVIDIDTNKQSDQAEAVVLHHDIIHNPATVFHFELQWIGTTGRYIEDQLRLWNKTIERYGLKLVEAYVQQIADIRDRNAFQSCYPVRLAVPPPPIPNTKRIPEGDHAAQYFEYTLLRMFKFILDVEASDMYPDDVDVVYSYRRSPYKYSQFIHRSGVAFVQVLNNGRGFLFLTNRLMGSGRMRGKEKEEERPAVAAERIRTELDAFCSDKEKLSAFYEREMEALQSVDGLPDPPPLEL